MEEEEHFGLMSTVNPAVPELDCLSYEEYFKKLDEIIGSLREHWKLEQRVKALKVAIQLSKLLAETSQMKLYSRKYKMITDTLDEFGRLVYQRIQSRANGSDGILLSDTTRNHHAARTAQDFHTELASKSLEQAKETCRNWFMKIASIRELVPRFYTELVILKICDVLLKQPNQPDTSQKEQYYIQSLRRLTKAAWGIGDPIVAIHARIYLCKVAEKLIVKSANSDVLFELILVNLESSARLTRQLDMDSVLRGVKSQKVDLSIFFDLISNGLQSIINLVTLRFDVYTNDDQLSDCGRPKVEAMFKCLITQVKSSECSILSRNMILHATLRALPGDIIAGHSQDLLKTIQTIYKLWKELEYDVIDSRIIIATIYNTMDSFALALDGCNNFESNYDLETRAEFLESIDSILEDLFKFEMEEECNGLIGLQYLRCFNAWLSYANHYVEPSKVDSMLDRFVLRIKKDRQYVNHYTVLIELIKTLATNKRTLDEFRTVFGLKSFSKLLELLRRDDHKLETSRWILETMRANLRLNYKQQSISITDKRMIKFISTLFVSINDSLSLLTAVDDIEHISQLIIYFLDRILIQDFTEKLNFYSRCRGSLGNLNPIIEYLARMSFNLAIEFRRIEKKRSLRQNYLNGCLAFAFITIPAINNPSKRFEFFTEGSRLALDHMSLSLADYYLKQTVICLNDLVQSDSRGRKDSRQFVEHGDDRYENPRPAINKAVLNQVGSLLDLMLRHEDHIDLKHKLVVSNLIEHHLSENPDLLKSAKLLNIIDDL